MVMQSPCKRQIVGSIPISGTIYYIKRSDNVNKLITCEQVSRGHPDKICDQIADAIVTHFLQENENARCAIEVMAKESTVYLAGEVADVHYAPYTSIINKVCEDIGIRPFDYLECHGISEQSSDIALGVNKGGAGDQGIMVGYATDETRQMMPLPYVVATEILQELRKDRSGIFRPDAKAQVTYDYTNNKFDTILVSAQHNEHAKQEDIKYALTKVISSVTDKYVDPREGYRLLVNPTGRFVIGGTEADTGMTGRKIVCDSYGGAVQVGGGAFSGKDPTKVDRSGAYMARYVARELVKRGSCHTAKVQVAYAIGLEQPVSIAVWADGCWNETLTRFAFNKFDWTPNGIIDKFDLKHFDYNLVSYDGHFGKPNLPWER